MLRYAATVAATLLCLAGTPGSTRAQSAQAGVAASGGYDEDVLGRPGDQVNVASTGSEGFLRVSPRVEGRLQPRSWILSGAYQFTLNRYGSDQAGLYTDHLGRVRARYAGNSRFGLTLDGTAERFRRNEYHDADIDHLEGGVRVDTSLPAGWTGAAGAYLGRNRFPARPIGVSDQSDHTREIEGVLGRRFGPGKRASLTLSGIENGSNDLASRYGGWRAEASGSWLPDDLLSLELSATYEARGYDVNPTGRTARDDWFSEVSLDIVRRIGAGVRSFARVDHLDYHSTAADYSFSRTTASAGLEFSLGSRGRGPVAATKGAGPDLSPRVDGTTVRFRHLAKGAHTVAVAGSFNDWRPEEFPMDDADGDGVWERSINLPPGLHRFMYLVDGKTWDKPEQAPLYEDDGFGLENGVIEIH